MRLPPHEHPGWLKAIRGDLTGSFEYLATKIMLGRLNVVYRLNPSEETAQRCISEIRDFFAKCQDQPKVRQDLAVIQGEFCAH